LDHDEEVERVTGEHRRIGTDITGIRLETRSDLGLAPVKLCFKRALEPGCERHDGLFVEDVREARHLCSCAALRDDRGEISASQPVQRLGDECRSRTAKTVSAMTDRAMCRVVQDRSRAQWCGGRNKETNENGEPDHDACRGTG